MEWMVVNSGKDEGSMAAAIFMEARMLLGKKSTFFNKFLT
jgi:hypothetical protein